MLARKSRIWLAIASLVCLVQSVKADDAAEESPATPPAEAASAEQIRQWAKDLDSTDFVVRKRSAQLLAKQGAAAVDAVAARADADDLDLAARSISILAEIAKSPDETAKAAARRALEKLTKSERRSVAQRADAALNPPKEPQNPRFGGANVIVQGQFRIGRRAMRIQARQQNGEKEVTAEEDGRKVQIQESPEKGITLKVTETVNGKEETKTYTAKTVEELKKQHPDAHKLYEKYAAGNAGGQLQVIGGINGGVIQLQAIPAPLPVPVLPPVQLEQVVPETKRLQAARERLEKLSDKLRKLAESGKADPESLKKLAEEIQQAAKELQP